MGLVKLQHSGFIPVNSKSASGDGFFEKDAILVHEGKFDSMDGEITITKENIQQLAKNHNSRLTRLGGADKALSQLPPVQVDHSRSGWDTVGRVVSDLEAVEHDVDGEKKLALRGRLRFMGNDNIERVKDGRWAKLSIGADLDDNNLEEVSITPFPAADNASLLSKKGGKKKMKLKKKNLWGSFLKFLRLMEGQDVEVGPNPAPDNLMDNDNVGPNPAPDSLTDDDDDNKLADCDCGKEDCDACNKANLTDDDDDDDDNKKKDLADDDDDDAKLMDDDDDDKKKDAKMRRLSAKDQKRFSRIAKRSKKARLSFQKNLKKTQISIRLSKLQSQGKVTPAEIKKMDIAELAKQDASTIKTILGTFENREPVIDPTIMGSATSVNLASLARNVRMQDLEKETRTHMSSVRQEDKKTDSDNKEVKASHPVSLFALAQAQAHLDKVQPFEKLSEGLEEIEELVEDGDHEGAVKLMKEWVKSAGHIGLSHSAIQAPEVSDVEGEVEQLASDYAALQENHDKLLRLVSA